MELGIIRKRGVENMLKIFRKRKTSTLTNEELDALCIERFQRVLSQMSEFGFKYTKPSSSRNCLLAEGILLGGTVHIKVDKNWTEERLKEHLEQVRISILKAQKEVLSLYKDQSDEITFQSCEVTPWFSYIVKFKVDCIIKEFEFRLHVQGREDDIQKGIDSFLEKEKDCTYIHGEGVTGSRQFVNLMNQNKGKHITFQITK